MLEAQIFLHNDKKAPEKITALRAKISLWSQQKFKREIVDGPGSLLRQATFELNFDYASVLFVINRITNIRKTV